MRIVQLTIGHESALGDCLVDFARAGETEIPAYFGEASWSYAEIVEKCGGEVDDGIEGPAGRQTKRFWIAL